MTEPKKLRPLQAIREFLKLESASGLLLMGSAVLAVIFANTAMAPLYDMLKEIPIAIGTGKFGINQSLHGWVNDGLMAIFFFLVGLEIKREVMGGELARLDKASLPLIAALGGMLVPGLIYLAINWGSGPKGGWGIPTATDIAFALGVMALLGSRAPASLKVLLTALAVIDDIGAIAIIAVFYSGDLSWISLAVALAGAAGLIAFNLCGVVRITPYVLLGLITWIAVLHSGVHATLAGVITAIAIPYRTTRADGVSPLERLEHILHPWVAFGVLPLFGFLNAGVTFHDINLESLLHPVTAGIALGLFFGKQIGVFGAILLAIGTGLAPRPHGARWLQLYGLSVLAGIGFTMSLFIGELAFHGGHQAEIRLGVMGASLLSALWGFAILYWADKRRMH
jgi:NhaA family Na+:H+ antiporter